MQRRRKRNSGMTLVEILSGVLIMMVLITWAIPYYLTSIARARANAANTNAKVVATAVQANYLREGGHSYLSVVTSAGLDATGGTLVSDLGGALPQNPCDGGGTGFADYVFVSAAASLTVVAKTPTQPAPV